MTKAEATTGLPVREPGRAVVIAAIHAYADWLADHPEVPQPHSVMGTASIGVDRVERFAADNDFKLWTDRGGARMVIVAYEAQSVHIVHDVVAS